MADVMKAVKMIKNAVSENSDILRDFKTGDFEILKQQFSELQQNEQSSSIVDLTNLRKEWKLTCYLLDLP